VLEKIGTIADFTGMVVSGAVFASSFGCSIM